MFCQACFEANTFWRIGREVLSERIKKRAIEFVWRSSSDLGRSSELFSHSLPWEYIQSDAVLFRNQQDIHRASEELANLIRTRRTNFLSERHLMVLWGHDFHFRFAGATFDLLDQCIERINKVYAGEMRVVYSTPANYYRSIFREKISFPLFRPGADFLPYQAGPVNWWNGYYTTRPVYKKACRLQDNKLRSAEILYAWASSLDKNRILDQSFPMLLDSRIVNGIMQRNF